MILFGTVSKIIDKSKVTVRIHRIHKDKNAHGATPDNQLPEAAICCVHGITPELKVSDVVVLAFERENFSEPVVIGKLFNSDSASTASGNFSSVDVKTKATLPKDTAIGDISYSELSSLNNNTENIASALSGIRSSINTLNDHKADDSKHVNNYSLTTIKKITLQDTMFGDATKMERITNPDEGQLFFLLEE